jgi:hypothetical protein
VPRSTPLNRASSAPLGAARGRGWGSGCEVDHVLGHADYALVATLISHNIALSIVNTLPSPQSKLAAMFTVSATMMVLNRKPIKPCTVANLRNFREVICTSDT